MPGVHPRVAATVVAASLALSLTAGARPPAPAPDPAQPRTDVRASTPGEVVAPADDDARAREQVARIPRATTVNDRDGNKLFDDLDAAFAASGGGRLDVIVSFVADTSTDEGLALVRGVVPGAPVDRAFRIIPAYAGALTQVEAIRVAALEQVRQVELDHTGVPELGTATGIMGARAVVDEIGVDASLDGQPAIATTQDVGIAILDTGIDAGHVDLGGKLVAWRDFGTGAEEPYDPNGHGTHVASIAAGWGRAEIDNRGVAPGAALIGVKIDGGTDTTSNTIAAYEWLVGQKDELNVRVATISFGFGTATDGTTALERAIDATWDAGIVCTKSNGNGGPRHGTMTVPAAARGILAIGSLLDPYGSGNTSKYGFVLSGFSSRGPTSDGRIKPDLTAPGESITAAARGTTWGYTVKSGTSMAAPFAAGTAALLIAADPTLTPDELRDILFATAEDRGAEGPDNEFGHGRLQVWHAVTEVMRRAEVLPPATEPPTVPGREVLAGAPTNGVLEAEFTVTDTGFPVALTVLGDVVVVAAEVFDPSGALVGSRLSTLNTGDRQHEVTFLPKVPGTYRVRVVVPPSSGVLVDVSHSTAPA